MNSTKERSCKQYITKISILVPSKKTFCKEYKKICNEKEDVKYFYVSILRETEEVIRLGTVEKFKNVCKIIEFITDIENVNCLQEAYEHKNNPLNENNVVILACKYNKCDILKHIFHPKNKLLLNLSVEIGRDELKPMNRDILGRTAFYYAIRENNVDLLDTLWSWPSTYLSESIHLQELDDIVSNAYSELKLRNVLLSQEIQAYVECKLIDLRFFANAHNNSQRRSTNPNLSAVMERIELVIKCNEILQTEYCGKKKVDEKFIFIATFVAQNIDVLKRQIKCTYERLPWEEIEFCLICFISGHKNHDFTTFIYKTVLTKESILDHLAHFITSLVKEKPNLKGADVNSNIPYLRREHVVKIIISSNIAFSNLYTDFEEVRNVYSMEKIISYIEIALASDPNEVKGQSIIERSLLITGEYLKNTLESPNLSVSVSDILLCSGLQDDIIQILRSIRNLLSHTHSLTNRIHAVKNNNSNVYNIIQNDLKKIKTEINEILEESKSEAIRKILTKILKLDNYEEIMELVTIFKNSKISNIFNENNTKSIENVTVEKLFKELKSKLTKRTFQQEKLLEKISLIIEKGQNNVETTQEKLNIGFIYLTLLNQAEVHSKDVYGIKFMIRNVLKKVSPKIENEELTQLAHLSTLLYKNIKISSKQEQREKIINKLSCSFENVGAPLVRILNDPSLMKYNDYEEIKHLINKIIYYSKVHMKQAKGLEALKIKYEEKKTNHTTSINNSKEHSLNERLQTLTGILSFDNLDPQNLLQQFSSYSKDLSLQIATESLVLDILGITKNHLGNNLLLFDTHCPILTGKCLRNHLAHGNAIVDVFPYSSTISVFGNAVKLIKENASIIKNNMLIGQPIINNLNELKNCFDHNMRLIKCQDEMFMALKEGNFEKLQELITKGAEIKGRDGNNMSALHIAACGGNLNIIKFLLSNGLDIEYKDLNGRTPLFLAISNGNIDIVQYFIENMNISIDRVDNNGRNILHVAAQTGKNNIIEYLLSRNGNITVKDRFGFSPVHFAIIHNHKDAAVTLLQKESGVDYNQVSGGFTPLHVAAENGHLDIVNYLIENNADVNAKNDNNWIPLHGAAFRGHFDVVKVLLLKGSEVNVQSVDGCTPLYYAIEIGCEAIVKILLEFGEKCNNFYENLNSVLPFACVLGNEVIVEHLLRYNINVNTETSDNRTPAHYAAEKGNHKILSMLIRQKANINYESRDGATPLTMAIQGHHIEAVKVLLENGANINYKSGKKQLSPLHVAALNGNELIIEMLIKRGADINKLNVDGNTALLLATQFGHSKSVKTLIDYGANCNKKNVCNNLTPIHIAASEGNVDIVGILLKNNVDVNIMANIQQLNVTPLHCAAMSGNLDIVKILVQNGANITMGFGKCTPLDLAIEFGNHEVFKYMLKEIMTLDSTIKIEPYLHPVVRQGHIEILELLLKNGAKASIDNLFTAILAGSSDVLKTILKHQTFDLNEKHNNITLLTLAAMNGNKHIIKILLQYGADPNKTDIICPLYAAVHCNNVDIAHFLLKSGAQVNVRCDGGETPLHVASGRGYTNVVEILLENGADVKLRDNKNRTALELAVANGHFSIVKTLFQNISYDVNAKGDEDRSLLHIAAQQSDSDIVQYLISKGADIHAKNSSGSKPIHIAAREGHTNIVDLFLGQGLSLSETGAANQTLLHYATLKNQLGVIKFLLEKKSIDVNVKDANGQTSLHIAAKFGFKEVAQLLLDNSAIYNAVDKFQCTPVDLTENSHIKNMLFSTKNLFECVKHNKYLDVEIHLRTGACIKAKNTGDVTMLHYASWKGYNETVISLLKNNADPNINGKNGYSCLHFAAKYGHIHVVKSLLSNGAIYNAVDHNGKTPSNYAEQKSIVDLLNLIRGCFEKIQNKNCSLINTLKTIKDMDIIKAILNAQNTKRQSIIVIAILNKFPMVEQLKQLFQIDVSNQINKAELFITQEKFQEALDLLKNVLQKRIEIFGLHNPSTLDIQGRIAYTLYKQKKYYAALKLFNEIYDRQKTILGDHCEDTLFTKNGIALVLHRLGQNEKAITIYQEVVEIQKEVLGKNSIETLQTKLHMALVLDSVGRLDEALKNNQEVFEMSMINGHTLMSLSSQNNIAMVLSHQKKYDEAIKIYKIVYERKKKVLGPHHSDTLRTLHNIGVTLVESKDYDKALNALNEVYEIQKRHLGLSHLDTLNTQTNIAEVLLNQGKVYAAYKNYKQCFNHMKAILGEHHPNVLTTLTKMNAIVEVSKMKMHDISEIIDDDTLLYKAVNNQNIDLIKDILAGGIDINAKDGDGRTALHFAANTGNVRILRILLEHGADIFHVTNKGNTPLHTAALRGCKEFIEDLLRHVKKSYPRRLSELLDAKTSVGGTTALHICTQKGNHQLVVLLLQNGACYNIKNAQLKSPIEVSKFGRETEMLLSYIDRLFLTLQLNQTDRVKSLINDKHFEVESLRNAILYARNSNGKTLLQIAKREVAHILLGKLKSM